MSQESVRDIQEYLRALSFYNPQLLPIAVDGFYGDETKRAVTFFQKEYGLTQSGEVDAQTWAELIKAYRVLQDTAVIPLRIFADAQHVLRPGEETALVPFLQLVLQHLSEQYTNITAVPMSGVYDEPTVRSVREIQKINGLEDNGMVDRDTWNVLARLYNTTNDVRSPIER